jgi:hypothetical protein
MQESEGDNSKNIIPPLCALMAFIDLHFVSMVAQHNTNSYRLPSQTLLNDVVYSFHMLFTGFPPV